MGSVAVTAAVSSALTAADAPQTAEPEPPELSEAGYLEEVLHVTAKRSVAEVVEELIAKASALGIHTASRPASQGRQYISSANSATTDGTRHVRHSSTDSDGSASTALTEHSSTMPTTPMEPSRTVVVRRAVKALSFSQYDKYLSQLDPNLAQPKLPKIPISKSQPAPSLFSVSTKKSYHTIRESFKTRVPWRKRAMSASAKAPNSCICCREDFHQFQSLLNLPCGHTYCSDCLHIMINHATTDESKMPPRCCTQPIPGSTVKAVLTREEQSAFLKSVLQFSTPWESRIFCPNGACGEFISPQSKIDPKHPFDVVCRSCRTRACVLCKRNAHVFGHDCPADWELDAVLKMGEKSGWRRCYKCRSLVELAQGCTHMTCRCKAQFCYICGAVWDNLIGCPNFCNGEEELEQRRAAEEARIADQLAEKEAREQAAAAAEVERLESEKRTAACEEFKHLRQEQDRELQRFRTFERKTKWVQWSRHSQKKLALVDKFSDQMEKMKERHAKTAQHLEDRQITAEMDFRATLEQSERSVRIRLKHMEAYCDGLGRRPDGAGAGSAAGPQRVVTERDLRELGQQYNVRDGMDRLHQARINVLRDGQAKRMEELLERQEAELQRLADKRDEEVEDLGAEFAHDADALARVFGDRKAKMLRRWELEIEILRCEMEAKDGVRYGPMELPEWPAGGDEMVEGEEEEEEDTASPLDEVFLT